MFNIANSIYVRTDHQCLVAFVDNVLYRIKTDPLLKQTYYSIHLGDTLIYFKDLVSKKILVQDPIGLSIYNARMKSIDSLNAELKRQERCQLSIESLFLLAGRANLLDGRDLSTEPVYVQGKYLLQILERAGYSESSSVEIDYGFTVVPDKMYFIPEIHIEDGMVNLIPDNVVDIVSESSESSQIFA